MSCSVVSLRRYPVKSMGGEPLEQAEFDARGMAGDRWFAVEDDEGRFASGKDTRRFQRRDRVFAYAASTDPHGQVTVTCGDQHWRVGDPSLDGQLSADLGAAVRVTQEADVPHQDGGAVSLIGTATLEWCAERWGGVADPRRLRANIVVETDEPFVEERWGDLEVGSVGLRVVERVPRCRTIDLTQDGAEPGSRWLKPLAQERDLCLAVYAEVTRPGRGAVGDQVQMV